MLDEKRTEEISELLNKLGIECEDYERLNTALTHSSYTFENKISFLENNERLEFLGDAVLKLVTSNYLHKRFPEYSEGGLTKIRAILISDATLTKIARNINLGKYLRLGFHEEKLGGRERASTLACAFEALLGALYLDGKFDGIKKMLVQLLEEEVTHIDQNLSRYNFKAILQEYIQSKGLDLPVYKVINETGPPHKRIFDIEVRINGELMGEGSGKSKKEAQQKAAEIAVLGLKILDSEEQTVE